jgi:hypothetical protein
MLKCWQIAYAWQNKFNRIVTNTRKRNKPMIHLNEKFDFEVIRVTRNYYSGPTDSTVVMELRSNGGEQKLLHPIAQRRAILGVR